MALDITEDPKQVAKGWLKTMYSEPPDLVLNEDTGFPAAMDGSAGSLIQDPVPVQPTSDDDWRANVKAWFDSLP